MSTRSWFEGTLDVISGMAPRPSTPVNAVTVVDTNNAINPAYSPMRKSTSSTTATGMEILRLPSQDSVDRSIHNDSGHGSKKTTAQIIRDLRQSNARLTERTAALEADFMNQLNQATKRFEERSRKTEETLIHNERTILTLEKRAKVSENRLQEKDEALQRLKEESAFQRHTISDLKTQLHMQQEEQGNHDVWAQERQTMLQELDLLKHDVTAEMQEKEALEKEVAHLREALEAEQLKTQAAAAAAAAAASTTPPTQSSSSRRGTPTRRDPPIKQRSSSSLDLSGQLEQTQQALQKTEQALSDLQSEAQRHNSEHQKQVEELSEQLRSSQEKLQKRERELKSQIGQVYKDEVTLDIRNQLASRDETIEKLRSQVLQYSKELTDATAEVVKIKAEADAQEQYRREEADDLRVLNDAQEEEIGKLKKELESILHELELREQEMDEKDRELAARHEDAVVMEESSQVLGQLQQQLDESRAAFEDLGKQLGETKKSHEEHIAELNRRIQDLTAERDTLTGKENADRQKQNNLESKMKVLEDEKNDLDRRLKEANRRLDQKGPDDSKRRIAAVRAERDTLKKRYESILADRDAELKKLRKVSGSPTGESTSDGARTAELLNEITKLKQQLKAASGASAQSGGAYEDDLRKQVSSLKRNEFELKKKLESAEEEKEGELLELRDKLQDRDTTISALVKSSVSMEQQIASMKIEMDLMRAKLSKKGTEEEGVDVILAKGEDLGKLKSSLEAYKETETRLSNEVFRLKRQLHHAKLETGKLRKQVLESDKAEMNDDGSLTGGTSTASMTAQLKERDEAIARLVKQTMSQEKTVRDLQKQLEEMDAQPASHKELETLRQETEMFAGQVIEQDEEIESLKNNLKESEQKCAELERQVRRGIANKKDTLKKELSVAKEAEDRIAALRLEIEDLKSRRQQTGESDQRIMDLEAEVDELKEANSEQLSELRVLRRRAREAEQAADKVSVAQIRTESMQREVEETTQEVVRLRDENQDLKMRLDDYRVKVATHKVDNKSITELQNQLVERDRMIGELKASATSPRSAIDSMEVDEMEMETLRDEIDTLRRNLVSQSSSLESAKHTIRDLERMAAERTQDEHARFEEEKDEYMAEVEELNRQLDDAHAQITELSKDKNLIDEFKSKLEKADDERELAERTIVDNYERKLSHLTLDKDVTIDKLRKELQSEKENAAKDVETTKTELGNLKEELGKVKEAAQAEINSRDGKITGLERTLEASQQLIDNMRTEMDHLQGSMVHATAGRREEIEDMQQELVEMTATTARQEREVNALRQQLEDKQVAHRAEIEKLQETIEMLENSKPDESHRNAQDLQMELKFQEVKDRLEKLKWRNSSLQEENTMLRDRLQRGGGGGMSDSEKEKMASLQLRVAEQTRSIKHLESELEKAKAEAKAATTQLPPLASSSVPSPQGADKKKKNNFRGFLGRRKSGTEADLLQTK